MVVRHPDKYDTIRKLKLANAVGANQLRWREATDDARLVLLFVEIWHMVGRDGVPPSAIHHALSIIPEYRDCISSDMGHFKNYALADQG